MSKIKIIAVLITGFLSNPVFTQGTIIIPNRSCDMAMKVCENVNQVFDDRDLGLNCTNTTTQFGISVNQSLFYELTLQSATNLSLSIGYSGGLAKYKIYGPFTEPSLSNCEQINMNLFNVTPNSFNMNSGTVSQFTSAGTYILEVIPSQCFGTMTLTMLNDRELICDASFNCTDCISSFSPPSGKYIVSAWVKEDINDPTVTSYQNAHLDISFTDAVQTFSLLPVGKIIDGWQKIEGTIEIPFTASSLKIELKVNSGTAYFDDVRFFPYDGSMMSYVYDPLSLRLMAELDERNYATLYEYDEEGKLIRVKKETEKGVMTIQENRDNIRKGQ
jgi:hypothetical protein